MQLQKQPERNATESRSDTTESNPALERIDPISAQLDSPRTKLVYFYLATAEAGTVEEVRDALGIELISLYPVLDTLTGKGLVERDGSEYVCTEA